MTRITTVFSFSIVMFTAILTALWVDVTPLKFMLVFLSGAAFGALLDKTLRLDFRKCEEGLENKSEEGDEK